MESLDRPYGDDETDYVTVEPELTNKPEESRDDDTDPELRAVEEAGGGQSDGLETAEEQLVENVENAPDADRTLDGFDLEAPDTDVEEDAADDVVNTIEEHDRSA